MTEYEQAVETFHSTPSFKIGILQSKEKVPYYYQYRDFSSFWAIIKGDSFWATDARFSNDSEEQRFGANIMHHISPGESKVSLELNEDYIVCFCKEDDKLSQWRGYTADGGVSLGFDFNAVTPFHILVKDQEFKTDLLPSAYRKTFVEIRPVCYLPPLMEGEKEETYYNLCAQRIGCPNDVQSTDTKALQIALEALRKCAPFIKHAGFEEEDEYRLVFRNEDSNLADCVRYRPADSNGIQRPYIVVRPGNPEYNHKPCVVRLWLTDTALSHVLISTLKAELVKSAKVQDCHAPSGRAKKEYTDSTCFGCSRRCWINQSSVKSRCRYGQPSSAEISWGVHEAENSVIISQGQQQEEIFNKVYTIVKRIDPKISVWCEGHLPIRSITVGPGPYQREAAENIRHYCRHVYWLRDVEVKSSMIPFRRAL